LSLGARIGVDVGGTFTDVVLALSDGRIHVNKTTTTPLDPGEGVAAGVAAVLAESGLDPREVAEVVHGTTVASNTILQKVGARTGLLTTRGFRDVLEIGRIRTPGMFDLAWVKPEPLVPRRWRLEALERVAADGSVVTPLDEGSVRRAAALFQAEGVEAVAVCFINSYANDGHERRAAAILRAAAPSLLVTASHEVLPEIKEYERTSTAVVNAYLLPAMRGYLSKLAERLGAIGVAAPVQVMASNGGMIGIGTARERPVFAVGSGPAGGVAGAARLGPLIGAADLIVFDMGGTTAKAAIVEGGEPLIVSEYARPLGLPLEDAAHGIRQVANVNMARAIRAVTVERGKDPRDMALMAFGGGGPLHAVDVARLLGIRRVLITPVSGVFSAAGMLAAEAVHEFIRPLLARLADVQESTVRQALESMAADGRAALAVEGYDEAAVQLRCAADVRYLGQSSQLTVPMPQESFDAAALHAAFERLYGETFGYVADGEPVELVNLRLSAIGTAASRLHFGGLRLDKRALVGETGERLVSFARGEPRVSARLLPRAAVERGPVVGPAIIESYDTTIVVPPGTTARAAGAGCIAIEMEETDA
jgi:N-methylhydantoinase A/oxoprolinase/acetone carboxylase beta subunit